MPKIKTWVNDALSLLYPQLCLLCKTQVQKGDHLCLSCETELPLTDHHEMKENDFTQLFYGRLDIQFGAAYLLFGAGNKSQRIIHEIKYKSNLDLAILMGKQFGKKLIQSDVFPKIDFIVPVPLHPMKQHQRGYNQSDLFGKGLSESLNIPLRTEVLLRKKMTSTQTKKSRMHRVENMAEAFFVDTKEPWQGKHILLIDDVITTGATLESCAITLRQAFPDIKISMATIAIG